MRAKDDVIIIGAGVIGLACAYYLSKEKLKVRVIEKNLPGSGDSTKTGGGIRYLHGSSINAALSKMSHSFWKNYINEKEMLTSFKNTGHLFLTSKKEELTKFKEQKILNERYGIDVETLNKDEIKNKWKLLTHSPFKYGSYCNLGGYLNHFEVINYLIEKINHNGSKVETNQKVEEILISNNKVKGVKTQKGVFEGKVTINATGANANVINRLIGARTPFISRRHELLIVNSDLLFSDSFPWLIDLDNEVHLRSNGKGQALVGGFLGKDQEVDPLDYDKNSSKTWIKKVLKRASISFGLIETTPVVSESWVGLYPGTKDYLPVIEFSMDGLITAAGFSGTGLMHAPAAGQIVRNLVLKKSTRDISIDAMSSSRFLKNQGQKEYSGF